MLKGKKRKEPGTENSHRNIETHAQQTRFTRD